MAITRAQQARQMLENGGRGISLQEAKDMAPKGEFLAYINKKEAKMLKDAGGSGIMTNAGIPSFIEYDDSSGSGFESAKSTTSSSRNTSNDGGGDARSDYIANYVSKGIVKGGGKKKPGTTGKDPSDYEDKKITGADVRKARDKYEQQFFDKGKVPPLGSRPTSFKTKLNQRNLQKRLNYINTLQSNLRKKLNTGLIDYQTEFGPFTNVTDFSTLDDYIDEVQSVQDLVEKGFYKSDGAFAKGQKIPDFTTKTGIPSVDIIGEIFGGPITSDKLKDLQSKISDLENLKTSEGLASTTFDDLMKTYQPNRFKLENPPTGGRDDDPILPIIPKEADDPKESTTPDRNLAGLSPRIGGSIFDFDQFAAEGGRIGAAEGGIMELARQEMFLGGIAKGLKKITKGATRAIKKIAKSPIGKAALLYAGGSFLGGLKTFGGAGFGQGNFFSNLKSGQGIGNLARFAKDKLLGTVAYDDVDGTRTGGILEFLKDNPYLAIGGASVLAGAMTPKKDDNQFDLASYYASQQLTPSQSVRGVGSEFDFYNYNLAEGGMPSKEPVAKETMPLLDMDGQEMDLRAEGGFVPIGRMEKADDVPARLSKNEFVFTADAVRNAGDGDVDKGAEVMYNMMKNLESGGDVSEESQGLEGAREMFQTSKRLEEVL